MLFPLFEITRDQYRSNLLSQLADPNCIIFFDTNLFSQLFKLYSGARNEFYTWFTSESIKDRVKITNWSMQEYNNRAINKKLDDYLDGVQILETVKKHLNNSVNFLQMFYDREIVKGSFTSKEEFMEAVKTVKTTFAKITDSVKLHENSVEKLNSEFSNHLQNAVINSDIYSILSTIQQEAEFRFQNNIPPGYQDSDKKVNKYGDLIIWKEILGYCRQNQVKSLIFVSNDGKKDIVYHPFVPKPGGKKTTESDVRFPDPRLFDEFRTASQGEKFSIISFASLISLLHDGARDSFLEISTAIQLISGPNTSTSVHLQNKVSDSLDVTNLTSQQEAEEELVGKEMGQWSDEISETPEPDLANPPKTEENKDFIKIEEHEKGFDFGENVSTDGEDGVEEDQPILRPDLPYSQHALADSEYIEPEICPIPGIVDELSSFDWYRQNDAITVILKTNTRNINDKNLLFVLGRRIYSAACGNAFEAIRYLENFAAEISYRGIFFVQNVASGIYYEIYFNSLNHFRKNRLKHNFIDIVFSWQTLKDLEPTISFIAQALAPYQKDLLIIPSRSPKILEVVLTAQLNDDFPKAMDFIIKRIVVDGKDITAKKESVIEDYEDHDFVTVREDRLLENISQKTGVPPSQLKLHIPTDLTEGKFALYTLASGLKIEI